MMKSLLAVLLITAAVLLFMRHAVPVEKEKKFFGGGVSLLLAHNEDDIKAFQRWAKINDPASVFGYNSEGIFTRSVVRKAPLQLPVVRTGIPDIPESALYQQMKLEIPLLEMEKNLRAQGRLAEVKKEDKKPFRFNGIPVFDEKGGEVARLDSLPGTNMINALLLKCVEQMTGTTFLVIESSGDRKFDKNVVSELEKLAAGGRRFSGVLALWPESRGGIR